MKTCDHNALLSQMRKMALEMGKHPNRLIMTTATLEQLKQSVDKDPNSSPQGMPDGLRSFYGLPVESYATLRECFDRMWEQQLGDRWQLVVLEPLTKDDWEHPWLKQQVETSKLAISKKYLGDWQNQYLKDMASWEKAGRPKIDTDVFSEGGFRWGVRG